MMQHNPLAPVLATLKHNAYTAEQLWLEYASIWQQLGWRQAQVELWLACLPENAKNRICDIETPSHDVGSKPKQPDLASHLVTLLQQAGKPLPMNLLLKKLPAGVTASEQQLRKLVQQDNRLEIKGPLVKLA